MNDYLDKSKSLGANESHYDSRTYKHDSTLAFPLPTNGGIIYKEEEILNQHTVGICTAISLVQNAQKVLGRKLSYDFQYLLQKKFYDMDWSEGSSIFNAFKVGKNIGFLPAEYWTYTTEADLSLPYSEYIKKLQAISDSEIERLKELCVCKLAGYAQVPTDPQSLAKAILDSKAGIICRYEVYSSWWQSRSGINSWSPLDIDPLSIYGNYASGHAITMSYFDFSSYNILANTWGKIWDKRGNAGVAYPPTEAWIPYYDVVPTPPPTQFIFTKDMKYGETSEDVKQLQLRLIKLGYNIPAGATAYYGSQTKMAVFQYQLDKLQLSFMEKYIYKGYYCGQKTRDSLNRQV